mmetsp:Transcript_33887/g.107061  ORF Transcript_33887/g.107061 Transcript_33887/m.107061 type:complete len:250 (+) Transcript_33887:1018-1767(+)
MLMCLRSLVNHHLLKRPPGETPVGSWPVGMVALRSASSRSLETGSRPPRSRRGRPPLLGASSAGASSSLSLRAAACASESLHRAGLRGASAPGAGCCPFLRDTSVGASARLQALPGACALSWCPPPCEVSAEKHGTKLYVLTRSPRRPSTLVAGRAPNAAAGPRAAASDVLLLRPAGAVLDPRIAPCMSAKTPTAGFARWPHSQEPRLRRSSRPPRLHRSVGSRNPIATATSCTCQTRMMAGRYYSPGI